MSNTGKITELEVLRNYFKDEKVQAIEDDNLKFRVTNVLAFSDNDAKVINELNYRYKIKRSGRGLTILIYKK